MEKSTISQLISINILNSGSAKPSNLRAKFENLAKQGEEEAKKRAEEEKDRRKLKDKQEEKEAKLREEKRLKELREQELGHVSLSVIMKFSIFGTHFFIFYNFQYF